jgi:glucokinase
MKSTSSIVLNDLAVRLVGNDRNDLHMMRILGLDVGGTSLKAAILRDGAVEWQAQSNAYTRPDRAALIDCMTQTLRGHAHGIAAAGICVPGILDAHRRTITMAVNVPGLVGVSLDDLVAPAVGSRVFALHIVNDAHAGAVDAVASLGLAGRVACIALGTGVGMSVLDDGRPLMIDGNSPGHIGQIDVSLDDDAPIGPDGGRGSLEGYIGVPALIERYGSTQSFLDSPRHDAPPLRALSRAIRIIHAIYRPAHVVLIGGIGIRLKHQLDDLTHSINTHLTTIARPGWQLHCGLHDFHAAVGAARLAMQQQSPST